MNDVVKIPDYKYNLDLIISQYLTADNLRGIISAADDAANDIETALFEIRDNFYLSTAVGVQLDVLGIIFGEEREGRIDEIYRQAIAQKAVLSYSGEPEAIIEILKSTYEATTVTYRPGYPGKYYILTDTIIESILLDPISPAGVKGLIEQYLVDAVGNNIIDAVENFITCVVSLTTCYILDGAGNIITDANGNFIYALCEE
jgi:hypothetical protein